MPDLTMLEAFEVSREVRERIDLPDRATDASVRAEWAAVDEALLARGIVALRTDEYGRAPEGHMWWVGQRADGHITGRWGCTQAEIAVCLSMRQDEPLRWLVPDPDNSIHRRYFPKPATAKTNWVFPLTDGPIDAPPSETSLFDLLDDWHDTPT